MSGAIGQVMQNLGRAAIELREGKYEAVIRRLIPYLTRGDIPEDVRQRVIEIFRIAVDAILPQTYEWEAAVASGQKRVYIPVPKRYVPLRGGEKVRVRVIVL